MDFGFVLPVRGPMATPAGLKALVERGEELGFSHIGIPDHVVIPKDFDSLYPYSRTGASPFGGDGTFMEQLAQMAYVAGISKRARLLTTVMVVPHRNPVHTAKTIATIDVLTGGRVTIGCGAGWLKEEFEALGAPDFERRGKATDEYLEAFKTLWTDESPEYHGEFVDFSNIVFEPKPVQRPHPPLWIGGESPAALRRTARLGDGWFPVGSNPKFPLDTIDKYQDRLSRLKQLTSEAGRDIDDITLTFWANWRYNSESLRTQEGERHLLSGSAQEVADDLKRLRDLNVQHVLFNLVHKDVESSHATMQSFVDTIPPLLS